MFNSTDCFLVMGRRGCGKSHLAKNIQKLYPKRIIIDSLSEYTEGDIYYDFNSFSDRLLQLRENNAVQFEIIFQFNPEQANTGELFNHLLRVVYYFGNVQIIIEEVQNFSSTHFLPHWLRQCLLIGRHQGLSLMFTTQRAGEIHKTILSQCAHIFVGQMHEGNDIRYISGFLNQSSEKLTTLPDRQFIYFSASGIKTVNNDFNAINQEN